MSLPFSSGDDKYDRKWTCFVCARQFKSQEQYVDHILEEHEEGRDYVRCAVDWCRVPVRDLAMHYKAQHKGEPLPANKQMKAIVWKDPNPRHGKMETRKPQFRKGWYVSSKTGKAHYYRSGWEERVYEMLDMMTSVVGYSAEPIEIPYFYDGEMHKYKPDLVVLFVDGRKELWEVKPSNQTSLEINESKWAAAKSHCALHGWTFVVVTEQVMAQMRQGLREAFTS